MVGDGGLGQSEGCGEVADAGLAAFPGGGDHGDQPQPGRVGQGLQQPGHVTRLAGGDRLAQQRRAAHVGRGGVGGLDIQGRWRAHLTSMYQVLTPVYVSGRVGIDSHLCDEVTG